MIAHDQTLAAVTLSGCIARIDAGGDNPLVPRLIAGIPENAAFHPVSAFGVATTRVPALFGHKIAQVLENEDACSMRGGEPDNASTDQVRKIVVAVSDLAPESGIVLLVFRQDASLRSVACNTS